MKSRTVVPVSRAAAGVAALLFLAGCAPRGPGSVHTDVPASAPEVAATDSAGDGTAIRAGYEERLRLGLGSPFRLVETVLADPRLDPASRQETALLLLRRTAAGEA
jgi:hypothetical protein